MQALCGDLFCVCDIGMFFPFFPLMDILECFITLMLFEEMCAIPAKLSCLVAVDVTKKYDWKSWECNSRNAQYDQISLRHQNFYIDRNLVVLD